MGLPNRFNSVERHKMCESRVGCLSKIDQEAMRAAMEAMAWAGATNLGRGPAIVRISVLHFQISSVNPIWLYLIFGPVFRQPNLVASECV